MQVRSPTYNALGTIDCEINHPEHGWIPFTASPHDTDPLGPAIYEKALAGELGAIAPYVPPVIPVVVPAKCTRRQGQLALLDRDVDALIKVEAFIAAIQDTLTRRKAEAEYFADTWERANPFLQVVWAQALDGTPSGLDDLFIDAVTR